MRLPPDWSEFIELLNTHGVRFLIVGAHALAAHGRPRATQDLDVFIEPTVSNVRCLGAALRQFGFTALADASDQFTEADRMATLGNPPLQIDIVNHITGVSFEEAWAGRLTARFGEHEVGFLGRREFRRNKRASGRPKDLADLALLDEIE